MSDLINQTISGLQPKKIPYMLFAWKNLKAISVITSLGSASALNDRQIKSVSLLGSEEKLKWKQNSDNLVITKPEKLPEWNVTGFRISLK